ncbi:MAG: RNA 2',3'-cyclic phosphodiesterase [Clostridiales Family XIII bacterium]|jgi:2'-5' RNA ligase|nr:RNA 2',3'-cyclic phosphodiesterase [Clostridiales Family XIII bacterium]
MRLFIAVNFNTDTRERLIALREELRSCARRGNFSLDDNLHLTLVFLGNCNTEQIADAKAAMANLSFEPFRTIVERVGRFKRDAGDIWWAGLREDKPLMNLQRELSDNLRSAGFAIESRKYSPHITLGREVMTDRAPWRVSPFGEIVMSIELMKSERMDGKLTYTAIYQKCLLRKY